MTKRGWVWTGVGAGVTAAVAGIALYVLWPVLMSSPRPTSANPNYNLEFKDDAASNAEPAAGALDLAFVDSENQPIDLRKFRGQSHLVLVVTRGYSAVAGMVCPRCTTQTSRLVSNYEEFKKRNAEVLVVFPGPTEHLVEFLSETGRLTENKAVPFPLLLDENFKAVDRLGIRGDLARPSTYIVDRHGKVRFAYVGANPSDRPSLKCVLTELDKLAKE